MQSIKLRSRVDSDGILRLEIPLELADREVDLVLVYEPVESVQSDRLIILSGTAQRAIPQEITQLFF